MAEDDEVAMGKRLAARFVRRPGDEIAAPPSKSLTPYLAAGAFVLLAAGGPAYYFLSVESSGKAAHAGSVYVAASFSAPFETRSGTRPAEAAPAWTPQSPGTGAGANGWAEAVETFRALAGSQTPSPQEKMREPQLEQLAAGYSGGGAK